MRTAELGHLLVVFADQVKEQLSLEFLLVGRVGVGHESVFGEGWGSYSVPESLQNPFNII